jgi:TfoX/Sxy family transcriptional regulator of competence genes
VAVGGRGITLVDWRGIFTPASSASRTSATCCNGPPWQDYLVVARLPLGPRRTVVEDLSGDGVGDTSNAGGDMKIPKPTAEDRVRFEFLVPRDARVEVKPMFGNLGAFVNGNMFMGLFGPDIGVKLNDAGQGELSKAGGGSFGPTERPMGGYVSLPATFTETEAKKWIATSLEYVSGLPPKTKKSAT